MSISNTNLLESTHSVFTHSPKTNSKNENKERLDLSLVDSQFQDLGSNEILRNGENALGNKKTVVTATNDPKYTQRLMWTQYDLPRPYLRTQCGQFSITQGNEFHHVKPYGLFKRGVFIKACNTSQEALEFAKGLLKT